MVMVVMRGLEKAPNYCVDNYIHYGYCVDNYKTIN